MGSAWYPWRKKLAWDAASLTLRRSKWSVILVDYAGRDARAVTLPHKRVIAVEALQPVPEIYLSLGHEYMHALSGVRTDQSIVDLAGEEAFIRRAENAFWPLVIKLGGSMPPLPEGFEAFVDRLEAD
jgi:hypothetical protein